MIMFQLPLGSPTFPNENSTPKVFSTTFYSLWITVVRQVPQCKITFILIITFFQQQVIHKQWSTAWAVPKVFPLSKFELFFGSCARSSNSLTRAIAPLSWKCMIKLRKQYFAVRKPNRNIQNAGRIITKARELILLNLTRKTSWMTYEL